MLIQRGADAQIKDFPLKPEERATRPGAMCEPAARRPRAQRDLARCGAVGSCAWDARGHQRDARGPTWRRRRQDLDVSGVDGV
jgi:hypothetical protein